LLPSLFPLPVKPCEHHDHHCHDGHDQLEARRHLLAAAPGSRLVVRFGYADFVSDPGGNCLVTVKEVPPNHRPLLVEEILDELTYTPVEGLGGGCRGRSTLCLGAHRLLLPLDPLADSVQRFENL